MPEVHSPTPAAEPITLLRIDADEEYRAFVADALESVPGVTLVVESDPRAAIASIDDVDCVVSALDLSPLANGPDDLDGLDLLATVRERHSALPFVLHTAAPLADVEDELLAVENTDYVHKDWDESTVELLVRRVRALVERDRYQEATRRLSTAIDAAHDPMLVVGSDDTIEFANGQFASAVSPARTDLCGRDWTDLFTDDSVHQLQHEAIPVGTEGWTWSGRTVLSAGRRDEVTARTTLVQLDDGSKVFAFHDLEGSV